MAPVLQGLWCINLWCIPLIPRAAFIDLGFDLVMQIKGNAWQSRNGHRPKIAHQIRTREATSWF